MLLLAVAAMLAATASTSAQPVSAISATAMPNTCVLYGATNWAGISILVILLSLLITAAVFAGSTIFPIRTQAQIKQAARAELTQAIISAVILVILASTATAACALSTNIANSLHASTTTTNPFQYAEYYIGNLSTNTGLNLLTTVYSISVSYSIESQVLNNAGTLLNTAVNTIANQLGTVLGFATKAVGSIAIGGASGLSTLFALLSTTYLDVIAPLITIAIGLLIIQFLALPVLQYAAFSILLPVAIAMRSLAFLGRNLRAASNTILAIAIAAYIIYPIMIAFNSYAIAWIFSGSNPSFQYLKTTYVVPNIPSNSFFALIQTTPSNGIYGSITNIFLPFVTSSLAQSGGVIINPFTIQTQAQMIVNQTAQFLFASIIMIVIDIAVTLGFAVGLANALNSGVEGAGSFWSGI